MTARTSAAAASLAFALTCAGCLNFYEIGIETPIQAKLDVAAFQKVLVIGFISGGSKSVDANSETTRLLRSQLRTKSDMKVLDADAAMYMDELDRRRKSAAAADPNAAAATPPPPAATDDKAKNEGRTEKELADFDPVFNDVEYWKRIGEEFQSPLIVTGTVMFVQTSKSGMVSRTKEVMDQQTGTRRVEEVREFAETSGFTLVPKFVFIDGRTGQQIYTETFKEETSYPASLNTPALSSYFDLMDKILPGFLNALSSQKIRGTRILLK